MARVNEQFLEEPLSMKELKDPIIFVVDMIEALAWRSIAWWSDNTTGHCTTVIEALIKDAQQRVILLQIPIRRTWI